MNTSLKNIIQELLPAAGIVSSFNLMYGLPNVFYINNKNNYKKKIILPNKYIKQIERYSGYRFLLYDNRYCLMILPNKNFIIGLLGFSNAASGIRKILNKKFIPETSYSSLNEKFRGRGLGLFMYKYVAKKYGIIISDSTLFEGSYKVWSRSLPESGGGLGLVIDWEWKSNKNMIPKDAKRLGNKYSIIMTDSIKSTLELQYKNPKLFNVLWTADSFIYFNNKALVPKGVYYIKPTQKDKKLYSKEKQWFVKNKIKFNEVMMDEEKYSLNMIKEMIVDSNKELKDGESYVSLDSMFGSKKYLFLNRIFDDYTDKEQYYHIVIKKPQKKGELYRILKIFKISKKLIYKKYDD